jgi:hypothetical protein
MQKAALGQSEGSEGEREENGRDGGARKRTSSDRSDGMGGRSIMKGGLQWLWVGLAPHPCASGSRHAAGLKRWQSRGTVRALPDAVAALLDAMRAFMRPAAASILQLLWSLQSMIEFGCRWEDVGRACRRCARAATPTPLRCRAPAQRHLGREHARRNKAPSLPEWPAVRTPQDALHHVDSV